MVSPDAGGVERARAFAKRLDAGLAIVDKRRERKANVAEITHIVGDVEGKTAIIVDDIVDTAGSITQTADALRTAGARRVLARDHAPGARRGRRSSASRSRASSA